MTTQINVFNEGPYDIKVEELEKKPNGVLEEVVVTKTTVLAKSQGLQTYIWKEKSVLVSE